MGMYMLDSINLTRKLFFTILIGLFIMACEKEQKEELPQPAIDYYYNDRVSFFEEFGNQTYDVVFIGDSIIDYANWDDVFPEVKIANRGIKSDTSSGVLKRLHSIKTSNADVAFLMIGTNDVIQKVEIKTVVSNVQKIVEELSPVMELHIQSILLTQKSDRNPAIVKLNQNLEELAINNGLEYIDLNGVLAPNGSLSDDYTSDGIHLNGFAYRLWAQHIESYILQW